MTASLFDMLSDNSSIDHPLCEECTDTLLQSLESQLEQAEQDSQQYQVLGTFLEPFYTFTGHPGNILIKTFQSVFTLAGNMSKLLSQL